jgi:hypothetical protein
MGLVKTESMPWPIRAVFEPDNGCCERVGESFAEFVSDLNPAAF